MTLKLLDDSNKVFFAVVFPQIDRKNRFYTHFPAFSVQFEALSFTHTHVLYSAFQKTGGSCQIYDESSNVSSHWFIFHPCDQNKMRELTSPVKDSIHYKHAL